MHNNSLLLPHFEDSERADFPAHSHYMVQEDVQNSVNALTAAGVKNAAQLVFGSRETAIRLFAGSALSHQIKGVLEKGKEQLMNKVTTFENRPEPSKENLSHHQVINTRLAEKIVESADFFGLAPGSEHIPMKNNLPELNNVNVEGVRRIVSENKTSETALRRNLGEIVKKTVSNLRHLGDNFTRSAQVRAAKTQYTLEDSARNIEALINDITSLTQDIIEIATNESLPLTERERQIYSYLDQVNLSGLSFEIIAAMEQSQLNIENEIGSHESAIAAMKPFLDTYSDNNLAVFIEKTKESRTAIARILGKAYLMKRGLI
ncbi:hypothetical protein GF340_05060 [Candidatus Peregrinibacteria bacterium]|nr:hypothetical protein [Candidatus Peregrinibacteria bacterium]